MLKKTQDLVKRIYLIESYKLKKNGLKNIVIAWIFLYLYFFQFP